MLRGHGQHRVADRPQGRVQELGHDADDTLRRVLVRPAVGRARRRGLRGDLRAARRPGSGEFEERPPDAAELARRIRSAHAWLVAEDDDGTVAGFAYASPHRDRAAYRWAVDVAAYVGDAHQRRGVGRALYADAAPDPARARLQGACAGIALPNDASVALHESSGFEPVGVYRQIGFKAGKWRDVGWWQIILAPDDTAARPAVTSAAPCAPSSPSRPSGTCGPASR